MKKFIVHTRAIPGKTKGDVPTVIEVEGSFISSLENPSVMDLPKGEFYFRITKPEFLYENGSPPVYHSHSVFASRSEAIDIAKQMVIKGFEFAKRKYNIDFTEEEVKTKCAEILKENML